MAEFIYDFREIFYFGFQIVFFINQIQSPDTKPGRKQGDSCREELKCFDIDTGARNYRINRYIHTGKQVKFFLIIHSA